MSDTPTLPALAANDNTPASKQSEKIYLIDGSAFIYRAFYAQREMTRSDGFPTNSIFIVTRLILKILRDRRPKKMIFIIDGKGKNFRHELYTDYKANRTATPEELILQLKPILEIISYLGIKVLVSDACEADDCLASLAAQFSAQNEIVIVGADKDLKQCITEQVVLWDPSGKDERLTTLESFSAETGMHPTSWADYQALIGDSSDNIPGLPGVGPKTAALLLKDYPNLEELEANMGKLPLKLKAKIDGKMADARLYRQLTTLRLDCSPINQIEELNVTEPDMEKAVHFMEEYELQSVLRELASMSRSGFFSETGGLNAKALPKATASKAKNGTKKDQASLFSTTGSSANSSSTLGSTSDSLLGVPDPDESIKALEQASLFSISEASMAIDLSYDKLERIGSVDKLPSINSQSKLALIAVENNCYILAQDNWSCLYHGALDELARHLKDIFCAQSSDDAQLDNTGKIISSDLKKLYKDSAIFLEININYYFDLSLASYLINPEERDYSWTRLIKRHAFNLTESEQNANTLGLATLKMADELEKKLKAVKLYDLMLQLEQPLIPVLFEMEEAGIKIDPQAFSSFLSEVQSSLEELSAKIYHAAGQTFNIRSSQQLGDILYEKLGLPKAGKTKKGQASTGHDALERLEGKHPIVDFILEYKKLEKLRSTYLEPLPKLADSKLRIHSSFNQKATATGRLSSSDPNLQNIPIRNKLGERMRACFCADEGNLLVSADYSQIELRVLAHLSQDPTLLEAFKNQEDIHMRTACVIFERKQAEISPDERRAAKTINFGLVYGMGPQKLAKELKISLNEAKTFIERYFSGLAKLKDFYHSIEKEAKNDGFVITMAGRRRLTPEMSSENSQVYSQAKRQAINTRIQGSAADIIKLAMLAVHQDVLLKELGARLILQVHDELILEVAQENAEQAGARLAELMTNIKPNDQALSVPLLVEWAKGKNWSQAH